LSKFSKVFWWVITDFVGPAKALSSTKANNITNLLFILKYILNVLSSFNSHFLACSGSSFVNAGGYEMDSTGFRRTELFIFQLANFLLN
jgi:hypothetical protein